MRDLGAIPPSGVTTLNHHLEIGDYLGAYLELSYRKSF